MKRLYYILIAIMAVGIMGCDHNPKPATNVNSKVDMIIIQHGRLQFYNLATQKLAPYETETDSVVNMAVDHNNHLYYTAAHGQDLALKCIDLSEANPQPQLCANWQLKLNQITDFMFGTGASGLVMDAKEENLYLNSYDFVDEDHIDAESFNMVSGQTNEMTNIEYNDVVYGSYVPLKGFYYEQPKFYYVTSEGKFCLNDKIDFATIFDENDLEDMFFSPDFISSDGKQIIYEANVEIGEGWGNYCLASSDGQHQSVLKDSDTWTLSPQWLEDGTLVYVGQEPRPEDDPTFNEEWNNTRRCIKIITPQGETSVLCSDAEEFALNPIDKPLDPVKEKQALLGGCDMAIFDEGKVTFYNSSTNTIIPFVAEDDYVVTGVFVDNSFYYTVAIGDELYLKRIYAADYLNYPELLTDWDLKLGDCYSESCGMVSPMHHVIAKSADDPYGVLLVGIDCGLDEDLCVFSGVKYYNNESGVITDYWPAEYNTDDEFAEREKLMKELKLTNLSRFDLNIPSEVEENKLEVYSISPSHDCIAYAYYTELGPKGGSGPLCFATVDGKVKMALEGTDVQNICYGWLNDGRLAYSDKEGIKAVAADGTITKIADGKLFVTVH